MWFGCYRRKIAML